MPTNPNPSLAPNSPSESLPAELAQALAAGLGPFSLRELLALILNRLGHAERQAYLASAPADKGNGSSARSLKRGSIPLQIDGPPHPQRILPTQPPAPALPARLSRRIFPRSNEGKLLCRRELGEFGSQDVVMLCEYLS
jgi:hypothetical protein